MRSGAAESNYGFWFPGKANDGGAGGGFEPAPFGRTWLGQPHHRGSWNFACEIDLGYCGALRMAATILADDPIFGRFCFGGDWRKVADGIEVVPKDGLRKRFVSVVGNEKLFLELDAVRFASAQAIKMHERGSGVSFTVEGDNPAEHAAELRISGLKPGNYAVTTGTRVVDDVAIEAGKTAQIRLPVGAGLRPQRFTIVAK